MNFGIPRAIGPRGPEVQNPFSLRRLTSTFRGAVIQMFPADLGRARRPRVGAIRWINVPRNFTFPCRVLVIRVFSSDRVNFRDCRKTDILERRVVASDLGPQTPTSQSSAYLTYLILENLGLGYLEHTFFRRFKASYRRVRISAPPLC